MHQRVATFLSDVGAVFFAGLFLLIAGQFAAAVFGLAVPFVGFLNFLKPVLGVVTAICIVGFMLLNKRQPTDAKKSDFDFAHHPILVRIGLTSFAILFLSLLVLITVGFAAHAWPEHPQGIFSMPQELNGSIHYVSPTESQIYRLIKPLPYVGVAGFFFSVLAISWFAKRREGNN